MTPQPIDPGVVKSLGEKAMIVRANFSMFGNSKLDKKRSHEVTKRAQAKAGSARVNKDLIDRDDSTWREVIRDFGALKKYHNSYTIPYDDNGGRLLDSRKFFEYTQEMRTLTHKATESVKRFITKYPELIDKAERYAVGGGHGELFNRSEYPTSEQMEAKFGINVDTELVPTGNSAHLLDISDADKFRIEEEVNARVEAKLAQAMDDPWKRIHKVVSAMVERLADQDNTFKNSLVENVSELVSVLPLLNIAESPELYEMSDKLNDLLAYTPKELRDDKYARAETADEAQKILDAMAPFYQA